MGYFLDSALAILSKSLFTCVSLLGIEIRGRTDTCHKIYYKQESISDHCHPMSYAMPLQT